MSAAEMICLGTTRAVSTDILHFRARVLGVYGQGLFHGQPLTPETVSAVPSSDRVVRFSRPSPPRHTGPRGLRRRGRSAVGGHATVSSDGHVSQAADLLASARARRAAAARSEEHTSELQSRFDLVCRLLLEKKKKIQSE